MAVTGRHAPGRGREIRRGLGAALGLRFFGICLLAWIGQGCGPAKQPGELSAKANYELGMERFEDEDYRRAIPYFQKILENYPFSIYAVPAELKIAEAYFLDKKYVEALVHLQGFQELHPTNTEIPYVIWMKAVCYEKQFSTIDRDVSTLKNAKRELQDLLTRFPESPYAKKAAEMLVTVNSRLARYDFYVARFYYRAGEFRAALKRFHRILREYPEKGVADRALYYIGKCYYFLGETEEAKTAFRSVLERYPESPYRSKAEIFLKDIEHGPFSLISRYFRLKERVFAWAGYE